MYKNPTHNYTGHLLFFILPILFNIYCSQPADHNKDDQLQKNHKDLLLQKPSSSFSDTISISLPSAVFYNPDSLQLEKIKSITDSSVFKSTMHEFFYQQRNARMVLKKYYPRIKIEEVKNARYIIFKMADGTMEAIDLDKKSDACGLVIFDGHKPPQLVDMTNVDSQLGMYFSR